MQFLSLLKAKGIGKIESKMYIPKVKNKNPYVIPPTEYPKIYLFICIGIPYVSKNTSAKFITININDQMKILFLVKKEI